MATTVKGKHATATILTDQVEDHAVAQTRQLCDQEAFSGCRIRLMPDVHPGKTVPVGFTATVGGKVMPAVVGTDIGCGMTMAKLKRGHKGTEFAKLDSVIRGRIPSGAGNRKKPHRFAEAFDFSDLRCAGHIDIDRAARSLGTLGGGNHFIEVDADEEGELFVIIHTGSRFLGGAVAGHYLSAGQRELKKRGIETAYELTWLEGGMMDDYLHDMETVQAFAEENRRAILDELLKGMKWKTEGTASCVHNYVDLSGEIPIMRKGAVSARRGETVIIPVSMKDGVIVGRGLGNDEWNCSAPHGAGRVMSREEARATHTVSEYRKEMRGIHTSCVGKGTLDEAPFAYRRMEDILPRISDTVKAEKLLRPAYNFKAGHEAK